MKNFIFLTAVLVLAGLAFWGFSLVYRNNLEHKAAEAKKELHLEQRKAFVEKYIENSDGWAKVVAVHIKFYAGVGSPVWCMTVIENKNGAREVAYCKIESDPHCWVPVVGEDILLTEDEYWRGVIMAKPKVK